MEMKDNFDDIIRRRWEERQFPVDVQHRADMAKLLDKRDRRKVFPFWWLFGIAGLVGVALLIYSWPGNGDTQRSPDSREKLNELSPSASGVNHDHASAIPPQEPSFSAPEIKDKRVETDSGIKPQALHDQAVSSHHASSRQSFANVDKRAEGDPVKTPNDATDLPDANHSRVTGANQQISTATSSTQVESATAQQSGRDVIAPDAQTSEGIPETSSSTARNSFLTPRIATLDIEELSLENSKPIHSIHPAFVHRQAWYLIAEFGGGLVFGSSPAYDAGWKLRAGGGLSFDVSPRVNLMWTGGYLMQQGGFDFERTSTVQLAGFGARSSFNTLSPDRLHHIYSRLGVNYKIHRHMLQAYVGAQWLYGMQGRISVFSQDQFAGDQQSSEYTWLKTDGLHRLRYMTGIGYGYHLTPRMMIQAGTDIYLTSLTREDRELSEQGYYWKGQSAALHPFVTLNYIFYGHR